MDYAAPYLKLIGRVILSLIFIQSGIGKIFDLAGTQAMMEQHGLPGWLLVPTILVEAGGGLCVLTGWFTRWAALALAGFCGLAAIFFHMDFGDRMQMINFMKNITIAGGFLVLAVLAPARSRSTTAGKGGQGAPQLPPTAFTFGGPSHTSAKSAHVGR
jgi:putative oxidoreductase